MNDLYADLSRYYDSENTELVEDLAAYRLLIERFGGPLLDVGCGTGRVALDMAQAGVRVVGIDLSPTMLNRAREREHAHPLPIACEWIEGDIRELTLAERFGLAIFSYSGFMHLLETNEQIKALARMGAHIKPGGGIALDVANPLDIFRSEDVPSLVVERLFTDIETGHTVMQQSLASFDHLSQIMNMTWVYDRVAPDGSLHRTLAPQRMRYTLASEMNLLLRIAGFTDIELYGDYDFNPYEADSPRLFVVATRAGDGA